MAEPGGRKVERVPIGRRPKHPLVTVREMMDKMMDNFLEPLVRIGPSEWRSDPFRPSVDVIEEENQLRVEIEMPGVDPKDVEVSVGENSVTIRGEKKIELTDEDKSYHTTERPFGSFLRTIRLPLEVDTDRAVATFKHGVMKITFPKTERTTKKIPIKIE
ncbi:MAG: Hsp20/alpha crystallin family protein [Syntrophorhabdus sp.]